MVADKPASYISRVGRRSYQMMDSYRLHCITSQMTIFTYRKQKFEEILQSAQFNLVFICTYLVANKKFIKCGNM